MTHPFAVWTIYDHPSDFPDYFVARKFAIVANAATPTTETMTSPLIEPLRRHFIRLGLVCITRSEKDDPRIVETWM